MITPEQRAEYRLLCDPSVFGSGHMEKLKVAVAALLEELQVSEAAARIAVGCHVRGMMAVSEEDGMGAVCLDGAGLLEIGVERAYREAREKLAAQEEFPCPDSVPGGPGCVRDDKAPCCLEHLEKPELAAGCRRLAAQLEELSHG